MGTGGYKCKYLKALRYHNDWINSICLLNNNRLASCSCDRTIKIINLANFFCEITIKSHDREFTYISKLSNRMLLASEEEKIKIYSITQESYHCEFILTGHKKKIWKVVAISRGRIASCSEDKTINIWEGVYPYNHIATFIGHKSEVKSIIELRTKEMLVSASLDCTLIFWDLKVKQRVTTFDIFYFEYNGLYELSDNRLIVGTCYNITLIDTKKFVIIKQIEDELLEDIGTFLQIDNKNALLTCGRNICLLNLETLEIFLIKNGAHRYIVNCIIQINNSSFATCAKTIKIWEIR